MPISVPLIPSDAASRAQLLDIAVTPAIEGVSDFPTAASAALFL
jgi:hypothetical protein